MTTDNQLAVIEQHTITPAQFAQSMDDAVAKAKTLNGIVEGQKLYNTIGGGKHLRVEAWQTIAVGYGLTPGISEATIVYSEDGEEIGAKARSVIYDMAGVIRGGAEAYCMRSEPNWRNKPVHQLLSMAGTRAVSKGLRLLLAWVVVLAGYEPTPAEEMTGDSRVVEAPARQPRPRQPRPAQTSETSATNVLSEEELRDMVTEAGVEWDYFVADILSAPSWEAFLEMGGTPVIAKIRWDKKKEGANG